MIDSRMNEMLLARNNMRATIVSLVIALRERVDILSGIDSEEINGVSVLKMINDVEEKIDDCTEIIINLDKIGR